MRAPRGLGGSESSLEELDARHGAGVQSLSLMITYI